MPKPSKSDAKSSRARASSRRPRDNAFVALVKSVQKKSEPRLRRLLQARLSASRRYAPEVQALVGSVSELTLRGGKRLRPALVAVGLRAADEAGDLDRAVDLGLSLEMLHTYLLIHDDWMDGDLVRRGGPTVHRLLAQHFRSEAQGEKSAVLAGDYALGVALELFRTASEGPHQSELLSIFTRMHEDAIFGQQLDIAARSPDPEIVYALKTGSYTVNGPLATGAMLGGGSPGLLSVLERFSRPAGIAFQLRDDLLGAFGDPARTGKPLGSDLTAGKYTLLVKFGLKSSKPAARSALRKAFGNADASSADIEKALAALEQSGAKAAVEARILALCGEARRELASRTVKPKGRELLEGALEALAERPL